MNIRTICDGVIEGPRLSDIETEDACHPACVAERLPEDAIIALIAAGLLALAPLIIVGQPESHARRQYARDVASCAESP